MLPGINISDLEWSEIFKGDGNKGMERSRGKYFYSSTPFIFQIIDIIWDKNSLRQV